MVLERLVGHADGPKAHLLRRRTIKFPNGRPSRRLFAPPETGVGGRFAALRLPWTVLRRSGRKLGQLVCVCLPTFQF